MKSTKPLSNRNRCKQSNEIMRQLQQVKNTYFGLAPSLIAHNPMRVTIGTLRNQSS